MEHVQKKVSFADFRKEYWGFVLCRHNELYIMILGLILFTVSLCVTYHVLLIVSMIMAGFFLLTVLISWLLTFLVWRMRTRK